MKCYKVCFTEHYGLRWQNIKTTRSFVHLYSKHAVLRTVVLTRLFIQFGKKLYPNLNFFLIFIAQKVSNIHLVTKDFKIVPLTSLLKLFLVGRVIGGGGVCLVRFILMQQ